jgi:CheY-like chemotaxis protein
MVRQVRSQELAPDSNRYVSHAARLLVVDDDVSLCDLVAKYLEAEGFEVHAVHSGMEGETASLEGNYELIVLDVMLPDKKGFEVLKEIRAHGRSRESELFFADPGGNPKAAMLCVLL